MTKTEQSIPCIAPSESGGLAAVARKRMMRRSIKTVAVGSAACSTMGACGSDDRMNSLLLTAHDYRTPRRANMHFIADELAKRGPMRFFSLRYSFLSRYKADARLFLEDRANQIETVGAVECFLWKAGIHPFNMRRPALRGVENALFRWSRAHPPPILMNWMREADRIFFESGTALLYVSLAREVAPNASLVYIASDDLATIDVADFIVREFERIAPTMDALCLPSPRLAAAMPLSNNKYFVPHGIDPSIAEKADPSPYDNGRHVVSVGSMLVDRKVFEVLGAAFSDVTFHVIGPGDFDRGGFTPNVRIYDEMAYEETLRYIKHADVGLAPYDSSRAPAYLTDTSMKLMQYRFFSLPAVCPVSVTGDAADRFGYRSDAPESIVEAMRRAFASEPGPHPSVLNWEQVTDRLIDPRQYPDTFLGRTS